MCTRKLLIVLGVLASGCAAGASPSPASPASPGATRAAPASATTSPRSSAPAPSFAASTSTTSGGAAAASAASILPGKKTEEVLATLKGVLGAAGHPCIVDEPAPGSSTLVCDKDDPAKPTLGVVYLTRNKSSRITLASGFSWKTPGTCAQKAARMNELNRGTDVLKVFCNEEAVTWTATLVVPTTGLTDEDVATFTAWFAGSVQAVLHESGLVPLLR